MATGKGNSMFEFHVEKMQMVIAMLLSGIIIACWMATKKSVIIDFIAALVGLFIVLCMLVQFKVI